MAIRIEEGISVNDFINNKELYKKVYTDEETERVIRVEYIDDNVLNLEDLANDSSIRILKNKDLFPDVEDTGPGNISDMAKNFIKDNFCAENIDDSIKEKQAQNFWNNLSLKEKRNFLWNNEIYKISFMNLKKPPLKQQKKIIKYDYDNFNNQYIDSIEIQERHSENEDFMTVNEKNILDVNKYYHSCIKSGLEVSNRFIEIANIESNNIKTYLSQNPHINQKGFDLFNKYKIEKLDPEHRAALAESYNLWSQYGGFESFIPWLDKLEELNLVKKIFFSNDLETEKVPGTNQKQLKRVDFYSEEEAGNLFLVNIGSNGLFYNPKEEILDSMGSNSKIPDHYSFTLSQNGKLYAYDHFIGKTHHSSPVAGDNILSAGMMQINNGKLEAISLDSGHYRPEILQGLTSLLNYMPDSIINGGEICIDVSSGGKVPDSIARSERHHVSIKNILEKRLSRIPKKQRDVEKCSFVIGMLNDTKEKFGTFELDNRYIIGGSENVRLPNKVTHANTPQFDIGWGYVPEH